ncbi:MAG: 4Fe-4S binding protein [Bacillota bacterium]|nr:4Fe-4S binding protein [Bacillota bacterium]
MNNEIKEFSRRHLFSYLWEDTKRLMAEMVVTYTKNETQLQLRPPFALPEKVFLAACTRCGECINVCPQHILVAAEEKSGIALGTPTILSKKNYCTMCLMCVKSCTSGALEIEAGQCGKIGRATINNKSCVAYKGSICNNCYQSCLKYKGAIKMEKGFLPVIDTTLCDGCGRCVSSCFIGNGIHVVAD